MTARLLFSSQDDLFGNGSVSFEDKYVMRSSCAPHAIKRMLFLLQARSLHSTMEGKFCENF